MTKIFLGISLFTAFFIFPHKAFAQEWHYPMDQYRKRLQVKDFGTLINDEFYKGKEKLFPFNRFYGYHAGIDLETFTNEKGSENHDEKVSVYAIHSGRIIYIGTLSGYGGVILQKLDNENATALYGHVETNNLFFKVGDYIASDSKPVLLAYLGNEFSEETSRERKHLHFGIYKGTDLYFRGHEESISRLNEKWYNPSAFLKERKAKDPKEELSPAIFANKEKPKLVEKQNNFLYTLFRWITSLFNHE